MNANLTELINKARGTTMTAEQRENQRQSFAYENARLENDAITRESIRHASDNMKLAGNATLEADNQRG